MKTINKINGQVAINSTIQFYKELCKDYDEYRNRWQNNYFTYKLPNYTEGTRLTPSGNFIYCSALKELSLITTGKTDHNYHYDRDNRQAYFELECQGNYLQFKIRMKQDINGVFLSLETNFKAIQNYNNSYQLLRHSHSHKVRSNNTFAGLDIADYFQKRILNTYLFAPGLFRNIQIVRNCNKAEAIQFYKNHVKPRREEANDYEIMQSIVKHINKKLNIKVCGDFTEKTLLHILTTYQRQKTFKKLFNEPSVMELSDLYSSMYDTEDNIEKFLNEELNDYPKNAIFI